MNKLCVSLENADCSAVFSKTTLQPSCSKVVSKILQKLEVEKIPHFDSAAKENDFFKPDFADDFSHFLLKQWDVLFDADRLLGEENAHICCTNSLQIVVSKTQEASKLVF